MKILADENIEGEIVDALRRAGHTISDIKETSPGIEDADVLTIAADAYIDKHGRIIWREIR